MPETVDKIRAELAEIKNLPKSRARTLSPAYYTSPEFLELEKERIFRREWVCLGHSGEIPGPGDYFTTEIVGEPLLITNTSNANISVLSNVCRHRGNIIAAGKGNRRKFTCGYHAWTYDNEGRLLSAPLMDRIENFDKSSCRLPEFKSEIWNGFIYVNLDGNAPPLAQQLEELSRLIRNYQLGKRHLVYVNDTIWNTNWKCLLENFMEGYHLTPTHSRTLHPITPTALCRKMEPGDYHVGYWSGYDPAYPDRSPYPEELTEEERRKSPMFWVAANHVVGLASNNCVYMCLRPDGVDNVAIRWGVVSTEGPESEVAKDYVDLCHAFNAEDKVKLESLQKGLKSKYLEPGPLAPEDFEGTIWDIYQFMAKRLGADINLD